MLYNQEKTYICSIGVIGSATDVTFLGSGFEREMNNFTLFFLCLFDQMQLLFMNCMSTLRKPTFFCSNRSTSLYLLQASSLTTSLSMNILAENVNYRTKLFYSLFLGLPAFTNKIPKSYICKVHHYYANFQSFFLVHFRAPLNPKNL